MAIEISPTTPASPKSLTRFTKLSIIFFPRKGLVGPNNSSNMIAIAINRIPKSIISRRIVLIFVNILKLYHYLDLTPKHIA